MYYMAFYSCLILFFSILQGGFNEDIVHELVIIGSGPAGLTAALYAARAGLQPLVVCGEVKGGQLTLATSVLNWPGQSSISGSNLVNSLFEHARNVGAQYLYDEVISIDCERKPSVITTRQGKKINTRAIIVATGTKQKMLSCPGEREYWGRGISHCALCDGALYKNKNVLVVGGGNASLENALHLKKFTNNITIITPEDMLLAESRIKNRVLQDATYTIHYNCTVGEFFGNDSGVTHATVLCEKTGMQKTIPIDGAFVAIGSTPDMDFVPSRVVRQSGQCDCVKTSVEGIFIAISLQYRQAIVSAGLGCCAAIEAMKYLGH